MWHSKLVTTPLGGIINVTAILRDRLHVVVETRCMRVSHHPQFGDDRVGLNPLHDRTPAARRVRKSQVVHTPPAGTRAQSGTAGRQWQHVRHLRPPWAARSLNRATALSALLQGRGHETEPSRRSTPPLTCHLLVRRNHNVPGRSGSKNPFPQWTLQPPSTCHHQVPSTRGFSPTRPAATPASAPLADVPQGGQPVVDRAGAQSLARPVPGEAAHVLVPELARTVLLAGESVAAAGIQISADGSRQLQAVGLRGTPIDSVLSAPLPQLVLDLQHTP